MTGNKLFKTKNDKKNVKLDKYIDFESIMIYNRSKAMVH